MTCPTCTFDGPQFAHYCARCGTSLHPTGDRRRRSAYAARSSENVGQLIVVSTVMPLTTRQSGERYRWAFLAASIVVLGCASAGLVAPAVLAAAVSVPIIYLVYLYDVNAWEDAPIPVVLGVVGVTAIFSAVVSIVLFRVVFDEQLAELTDSRLPDLGISNISVGSMFLFAIIVPVVTLALMSVVPLLLARTPRFDDMIDGFTLGVAAGVSYAAAETLVLFAPVFSGEARTTDGLASWFPVVLNLMVGKSLIYGTACAIAVAAFSGRGAGYDGFTRHFATNFGFGALALVAYWMGLYLFAYADFGQGIALLWALAIVAILVLRARVLLHTALVEAAIEDAARGRLDRHAGILDYCVECEMAQLPDAVFCLYCGQSVRAVPRLGRATTTGATTGLSR
jgi:RsiW-degrading membrane proteinase PrsW (M82 family)